jgi:hypothetical protein
MKLAIIDTAADTADVVNSAPDISANELTASAVNADTLLNADVAGAADNQILATDGNGNLTVESQAEGPNPYDQAQTFAESGVTVTQNSIRINNGSIELSPGIGAFPDDFEDGVDSGWSGDTGVLTAQTSVVLAGGQSAELTADQQNVTVTSPSVGSVIDNVGYLFQISDQTQDSRDSAWVNVYNDSGSRLGRLEFQNSTNDIIFFNGSDNIVVSDYWSAGTTVKIEWNLDFSNNEVDIILDETNQGTFPFENPASSWDYVEVTNNSGFSGNTINLYFDNRPDSASGNALIEWDKGVPTDIFAWDVATFTRTLDGETVTVDVEDGQGNVLLSDIDRNTDISSVAANTNVKLRVNLSRNDTANNPTLDSAYRSWLV